MEDKFKGTLLGLIVGDALGAPYEGFPRNSFQFEGEMQGGGPHDIVPGQWTDDSSLALCLAESLIKDGFSLNNQLARYAKWYQEGYLSSKENSFGVGRNTSISISEYIEKGILPPKRENAAGNGSIMRLAPVAMYFFNNFNKTVHYAGKSSLATHNNPMAVDSCKYLGAIIYKALEGKGKEKLLDSTYQELDLDDRVLKRVSGDYKEKSKEDIVSDAFVLNTLEASLWSFYNSSNFASAMDLSINLGGDTDTIAAVTGQIAGAYYGADSIPEKWVNKLTKKELIMSMIRGLYQTKKH